MHSSIRVLILAAILFIGCAPEADLTLRVVDPEGEPVVGALVEWVTFREQLRRRAEPRDPVHTDTEGRAVVSSQPDDEVDVTINKPGWYTSRGKILRTQAGPDVEIVLRPEREPIAMSVRHIDLFDMLKLPEGVNEVGYDMLVGDRVAPYGEGKVADFRIARTWSDPQGRPKYFRVDIRFADRSDGIQRMTPPSTRHGALHSDYEAPADGYQSLLTLERYAGENERGYEGNLDMDADYYVRVRSARGGPLYGKIYGEFPVVTTYLNPSPGDRNVEWEVGANERRPGRGEHNLLRP